MLTSLLSKDKNFSCIRVLCGGMCPLPSPCYREPDTVDTSPYPGALRCCRARATLRHELCTLQKGKSDFVETSNKREINPSWWLIIHLFNLDWILVAEAEIHSWRKLRAPLSLESVYTNCGVYQGHLTLSLAGNCKAGAQFCCWLLSNILLLKKHVLVQVKEVSVGKLG